MEGPYIYNIKYDLDLAHVLLTPSSDEFPRKSRAIPLLTLRAFVACKDVESYLLTVVLILSLFCVLNFMPPSCKPHLAGVAHTSEKVQRTWSFDYVDYDLKCLEIFNDKIDIYELIGLQVGPYFAI